MISPLGRGHRGGTLSITSSWAQTTDGAGKAAATEGRTAGTLGSASTAATEGAAEAAIELGLDMEVPVGGVGPWRTCGLKE